MNAAALSLSLSGLREVARDPRAAIEWVASLGYRAIQLNATMPGLRARELDRSARRGIVSLLGRLQLELSGLDLWIPPEHFVELAQQQRAIDAVEAAVGLAADLIGAGAVVSMTLPGGGGEAGRKGETTDAAGAERAVDAARAITTIGARFGARVADHQIGAKSSDAAASVQVGIDPAEVMRSGGQVGAAVAQAGRGLIAARLSDWDGRKRVAPGTGKLDLLEYAAGLSVAGYEGPVVLDLRDVEGRLEAAREAVGTWPPM